jgi:CheY-like chemotaxis protein
MLANDRNVISTGRAMNLAAPNLLRNDLGRYRFTSGTVWLAETLIFEPRPQLRSTWRDVIANLGLHEPALATTLAECIALLATPRDLVIMPLSSDGSETELLKSIRASRHNRRAALIAYASYPSALLAHAALEAGVDDFLALPCSPEALARRVISALRRPRPLCETDDGVRPKMGSRIGG